MFSSGGKIAALSKEQAMDFYIPKAKEFFERGMTDDADVNRARACFYNTCEFVKRQNFLGNDRVQVAEFYRHRGKMLGIDTSFITPDTPCSVMLIDWMGVFWDKVKPLISSPALNRFLFETNAINSKLIWSFLLNPHGYLGNELIYQSGFDPLGFQIEKDRGEAVGAWPYHNGLFSYRGLRDWQITQKLPEAGKILIFNCSGLPELRLTGYIWKHNNRFLDQILYVSDSDPNLDFDFLMKEYMPGMTLPKTAVCSLVGKFIENAVSRIKYYHMTNSEMIVEMLNENERFDFIYAKDVLFSAPKSLPSLVQAAMGLLEPGGSFLFDLPLNHFSIVRDAYFFSLNEKDYKISQQIEELTHEKAIMMLSEIMSRLDISPSQVKTDVATDEEGEKYGVGVIIKKEGPKVKKT